MGPALALGAPAKQIKLASELRRLARIMSTSHDLRDVSSVLHLVQRPRRPTRRFDIHRLYLLNLASTKGQPANLYYNQQGNRRPPRLRACVLAWLSITSSDGPLNHPAEQSFSTGSKTAPPPEKKKFRPTNRFFGLGISYTRPPYRQEDSIAFNSVHFKFVCIPFLQFLLQFL
jgi:hypothetical protein